jgi:hypothetical protein
VPKIVIKEIGTGSANTIISPHSIAFFFILVTFKRFPQNP